ncbi:ABC transporter permease [Thalassospira sp. GO-4]|jgi:peptide/nickel transport system permease protein|uniref:nickel transporter permease n=1 Tax=Thalassospira sp. GO-4 TaxID=2946605 RepID=UPI0020257053|nr:nickel transporter permease [Thalassospira sp. GO-4]URK18363.1 ABC transporter permease [Thalassospira sp. GO-4]
MNTQTTISKPGLKQWLTSDTPRSRLQAKCGRAWLGWIKFTENKLAMIGLSIVIGLILVTIFAPLLAPYDPLAADLANRIQPPGADHWFGTDQLGRDILSRLIYGAQYTLLIVGLVAITAAPLGLLVGTAAGFFGGWVDATLMRITDIFLAFPKLILALAFVSALGPGLENAILAIASTAWPPYARIARAETITVRKSDFIEAARLQGTSNMGLIIGHIMPMCMSSLVVRVTLDMAGMILIAAGLGFLGLGAQPPMPEWGAMVSDGRQFLLEQWWVATVPGIAIFVVSLGFNLLGDGLRDVLDPRGGD